MENQEMPKSYNQAVEELEKILEKLRRSDCDVDALAGLTSRAASLLEFCQNKLTATEADLQSTLSRLEQPKEGKLPAST